ncbi:MAG TPA: ferritin-like domain-containing protein [Gemmatimonadota bacterium]|nr:ferritin-like domain-containing protein [Gemmatimonadota bacterium]
MSTFRELFLEQLGDIHSAETQITEALPKLIDAVSDDELKDALSTHLHETRKQIERLSEVFAEIGERPVQKTCLGMKGLLKEGDEGLQKGLSGPLGDALIIANAQRVEHYEISAYGTAIAWARQLDLDEVADLLDESLDEEAGADEKLTSIAEGGLLTAGLNEEAVARK